MKRNKGMQLSAVLAVMLIVSMVFVPAVSAQAEKAGKKNLPQVNIDEWIVDKDDKKEYKATIKQTIKQDDIEKNYYVKQWQEKVDGIKVWKFSVYEISPDGVIAQDISFGRGSYFWTDSTGIHFHFSERDKDILIIADAFIIGAITIVIAVIPGMAPIAGAFVLIMSTAIAAVDNIESNNDGSIDVFISWWYVGLIPIYMGMSGKQTIKMKIGSHYYPVLL